MNRICFAAGVILAVGFIFQARQPAARNQIHAGQGNKVPHGSIYSDSRALSVTLPAPGLAASPPHAGMTELQSYMVARRASAEPPDNRRESSRATREASVRERRIPEVVPLNELASASLAQRAVPLPEADTLSGVNYTEHRFGRLQAADGDIVLFNPQVVLVKFKGARHVAALRVESGDELEAVRALFRRPDVEFAELDTFQTRAGFPDDPLITNQWHHQIIGSYRAWKWSLGQSFVRIAIVDTPFQMNHPDLAPNIVNGWDAVRDVAITNSGGIDHSTLCAGMAAAVINNDLGVAGAGNCAILPININGAISEMYDAVIWAADHGVRLVNISWTGAESDTLNAAGEYLRTVARGVLAMPGGNGPGLLDYTNQPDIWCISMTDAADNTQSAYGNHIDFAAPGWNIFSTTTGGGYGYASGTSYATPLFCGVVAVLFSINPTLGPEDAINILKNTAYQPNGWPAGWNQFYGWGRIDFGAAAAAAYATLPEFTSLAWTNSQVRLSATFHPGLTYTLWRNASLASGSWLPVTDSIVATNGDRVFILDPSPDTSSAFYRIEAVAR